MTNPKSKTQNPKSLVLGIDTGGTYTDGVLLDYASRQVLASHKSLTTKRDLSIGIEAVIENIAIDDPSAIKMVSISTTLATNAIAESAGKASAKGKRAALLLIGYDPDLVATFKMTQRFATPHYYYFAGGHDFYGQEKEPLDLPAILSKVEQIKHQVEAIAVSSYFSPLNAEHEHLAYQAMADMCDLPIVLGHQLSTKLNSIERATTAALNASLLAVLQEFIVSVQAALKRRQIKAPLMVVRGDGTLMSDEFAARTPVETIHSGPAASAIGGRFLSRLDDALVIDVGGTTTDLALIQNGQVTISEEGATVGHYKTAVKAANLLSIALGGDSHITLCPDKTIAVGPERVVPLAFLAWEYPQVSHQLKALSMQDWAHIMPESLDYYFLLRRPKDKQSLRPGHELDLFNVLSNGPQSLPEILKHLNLLHVSQLNLGDLQRREIIGKAGLTPTDLLHVEGHYTLWNVEAAAKALDTFARFLLQDSAEVRRRVWSQITETIVQAIITFLTGKQLPPPLLSNDQDMGRWFFNNSLGLYPPHPQLETRIRLRPSLIGIGAPAGFFLQDVARILQTELILPDYYQVANAVGAVAGSIVFTEEILIYPRLSAEGLDVIGYYVQDSDGRELFEKERDALTRARTLGQERALDAVLRAGADNPQVSIEEVADGIDTLRIRARAVGNPRLGSGDGR